jgi:hypothetical protein
MATRPLNGRQRQGRNLAGVAIAAVCVGAAGVGVASSSGGNSARQSGGPTEPRLQPLVTHPAPDGTRRLRLGELRVKPTAIVAGAEDQDIRVTLDPAEGGGPDRVRVLLRPVGRGLGPSKGPKRTLDLAGGSAGSVTFQDLNLPPGDYKLRLTTGSGKRIGGSGVVVYAQHRLPPGAGGGSAGGDEKVGPRALPSPSTNNNVSEQTGDQAETYDAVETDNAARVAASVNPSSGNPDVWISNDFMRPGTEVERTMPSNSLRTASEGGGSLNLNLCCDPSLAADDRGNIWLTHLATSPPANYIAINRIAGPSGTTLQASNVAIPRGTTGVQDKPMSTIDSSTGSPKKYRLYEVWIQNPGQAVVISECDAATASSCDSPANWPDVPAVVEAGSGTNSYPAVAAAPNGDVYVVWWDQDADQIVIDRCLAAEDCTLGASWNESTAVDDDLDEGSASDLPFFCPIISAPGGRVGPQSYVDVGPDGRVYVAYSELRNNGTTRCTASGTDRTFESRIAAGAPNTFPALNSGVRISDDGASALNDHFFATLAADPSVSGRVESSLYSTKLDASGQTTNQFYVSSSDGGASYSAMTQISTASSDFSGANSDGFDYGDYEGADAAAGLFLPAWTDNRAAHGGDAELYMLTPDVTPPPPPAAPTLNDTDPDSPANDNQPEVKGTAEAGSTVDIYTNALCTGGPVASGSAAQLASPGITVTVLDNSTTTFHATATNTGGPSPCSAGLTYMEVTPAPPSTTPPTPTPAAPSVLCRGRPAITGTSGANALNGTGGSDALAGLGGKDTLRGKGGNDVLCGGGGKDLLIGGGGKDVCVGGAGVDTARGCEKRKSI